MRKLAYLIPLVLAAVGCGSKEEALPTQQDIAKMSSNPETNTLQGGTTPQGTSQSRGFGVGK